MLRGADAGVTSPEILTDQITWVKSPDHLVLHAALLESTKAERVTKTFNEK